MEETYFGASTQSFTTINLPTGFVQFWYSGQDVSINSELSGHTYFPCRIGYAYSPEVFQENGGPQRGVLSVALFYSKNELDIPGHRIVCSVLPLC